MKLAARFFLAITLLLGLVGGWRWLDYNDYFNTDYRDLTQVQQAEFDWQAGDDAYATKLRKRYTQHFDDANLFFPRQPVVKVAFFKNLSLFGGVDKRILKTAAIPQFIKFCNNPTNFRWSETTWTTTQSDYYCNLYGADNKVAGKIYFCLDGCFMTDARPFCPAMKFGMLSTQGFLNIKNLISNEKNWE